MNRVFAWPVGQTEEQTRLPLGPPLRYLGGSVLGGSLLGLILAWAVGITSAIALPIRVYGGLLILCLSLVSELRGTMRWWPQVSQQVPRAWIRRGADVAAWRFGLILGFGALTYLHHAAFYGMVATLVVVGSMPLALVAGVTFGLVRGVQPMLVQVIGRSIGAARAIESILWSRSFDRISRVILVATLAFTVAPIMQLN